MKFDGWRLLRILFAEVIPRVALVWVLVVCGMNWLNNHLVYYPQRQWDTTPADFNLPYEDVTFVTADGVRLSAWHIPAQAPAGR